MHIKLPEKRYYTIGEIAIAFQVKPSLIRFWEKEFDILKPQKSDGGQRKFTREDIGNIQTIYYLVKERGYTLEGARIQLKGQKKKKLSNIALIHKLENIKASLLKIRTHL